MTALPADDDVVAPPVARWLIACYLFVLTAALFARSGSNGFINLDDPGYLTANATVRNGLTLDGVRWAFTTREQGNWHPLTWLSMMTDVSLFGLDASGHHAMNVLLFDVSVVLLFYLLSDAAGGGAVVWRSAVVAALFAFHPLRVESVAWASERKDVLSLLFGLAALLAYVRYTRSGSRATYAILLVSTALSLLSKATFVTMPAMMFLLDFWPLRRNIKRHWREKLPVISLCLLFCISTYLAQSGFGATQTFSEISLARRATNIPVSYVRYLGKFFWPAALSVYYPFPPRWSIGAVLGSAALLIAITVIAAASRRKAPYLLWGWVWFVLTFVPMIGIVQVGWQSMADRYTLVPTIGLTVAVVWLVADWLRGDRAIAAAMTAIVILALAYRTFVQLGDWRDSISLFQHALINTGGDNFMAELKIGEQLLADGRDAEAEPYLRDAIRDDPRIIPAYFSLGNIYVKQHRYDEATKIYEQAIARDPRSAYTAQLYIGITYLSAARPYDAIDHFREAIRLDANRFSAHQLLGHALMQIHQSKQAIDSFQRALALNPKDDFSRASLASLTGQTPTNPPASSKPVVAP